MPASRAIAIRNLTKAADAAPRCQHIRLNGTHCAAPARTGHDWCLFHHGDYEGAFPTTGVPEDAACIQIEVGRVIRQLQDQSIEARAAGLILYGLQVASMNLPRLQREQPSLEVLTAELQAAEAEAAAESEADADNEAFPQKSDDLAYHMFIHLNAPSALSSETYSRCVDLARFVRGETPANRTPATKYEKKPPPNPLADSSVAATSE